ncbi:hypothetical protein LXL04_014669 [Taraxacum kok-saghyz]
MNSRERNESEEEMVRRGCRGGAGIAGDASTRLCSQNEKRRLSAGDFGISGIGDGSSVLAAKVRRWLQPADGLQWLLKVEIGERTAEGRDLGEEIWNFSLSRDGIWEGFEGIFEDQLMHAWRKIQWMKILGSSCDKMQVWGLVWMPLKSKDLNGHVGDLWR